MIKIQNKKHRKNDLNTKKPFKKFFRRFLIFSELLFIGGCGVFAYGYNKYGDKVEDTIRHGYEVSSNINVSDFNNKLPTQIYDINNNLLREFNTNEYIYKELSDMNPYVSKAVVSIEDERFYEHGGIDYKGIARSLLVAVKSKGKILQGGSTITQQLAKNIYLTFDRNMFRKIEEMVVAKNIEKKFSKEEIIEFYVNNINYGFGCYSFETASEYYFQKPSKELTIGEVAMITGIPNNPSLYNPINEPENAIEKRNIILSKMFELGHINQAEYEEAKNEELKLNVKPDTVEENVDYATSYAIYNAVRSLMKEDGFVFRYSFKDEDERIAYFDDYNEKYSEKEVELLSGGYRIDTTIDMEKQEKLQSIVDDQLAKYNSKDSETGLYEKQSAVVTIDNKTGEVVAIVGGRSEEGNTFNRAFLAVRQPGSTIKPLVAYTPSFERGYLPSSKYNDAPIDKGPKNYDFAYRGLVTLRFATEYSINSIPFRLVEEFGTSEVLKYLTNMEFGYISPKDTSPIVAVGGLTRGVTPVEMASAYSTIARNGEFISPTNVRKITIQSNDKVIYENKQLRTKIYDSGASYLMTDVMKGVLSQPHGTGYGGRMSNYPYQAGKTGTTDEAKDVWFAGYTPLYTTMVWIGNDIPAPQKIFGGEEPGHIWKYFMEYLHEGKEVVDFNKPDTVYETDGKLVNSLYIESEKDKERKEVEKNRIEKENREQLKRLEKEDYRIKYGVSKENEMKYENIAEENISKLESITLTNKSQYNIIDEFIKKSYDSITNVKHQEAYNNFLIRIENKIAELDDIKFQLEKPIEEVEETPADNVDDKKEEPNVDDKKEEEVHTNVENVHNSEEQSNTNSQPQNNFNNGATNEGSISSENKDED